MPCSTTQSPPKRRSTATPSFGLPRSRQMPTTVPGPDLGDLLEIEAVLLPAVEVAAHRPLHVVVAPDEVAVRPGGALVPANQRIGESEGDLAVAVAVGLQRDLDQLERRWHRATVLPTHRRRDYASHVGGRPCHPGRLACRSGGLHPLAGQYRTIRILDAPWPSGRSASPAARPSADILPHDAVREAAAACARIRLGEGAQLRHRPRPPRPLRVDRRAPRRASPSRSWSPTARWRRRRSSSGTWSPRATGWSSSSRPTTARCCCCAAGRRGAGRRAARGRRRRPGGGRGGLRRGRGEARPRHPQLPQPGRLHALPGQAERAWSSSRPSNGFTLFEDDPYRLICFEKTPREDDARDGHSRPGDPRRRRSRSRSAPASASATWSARRTRSPRSPSVPTRPTSRRTCSPSRSSSSSAARAGSTRTSRS